MPPIIDTLHTIGGKLVFGSSGEDYQDPVQKQSSNTFKEQLTNVEKVLLNDKEVQQIIVANAVDPSDPNAQNTFQIFTRDGNKFSWIEVPGSDSPEVFKKQVEALGIRTDGMVVDNGKQIFDPKVVGDAGSVFRIADVEQTLSAAASDSTTGQTPSEQQASGQQSKEHKGDNGRGRSNERNEAAQARKREDGGDRDPRKAQTDKNDAQATRREQAAESSSGKTSSSGLSEGNGGATVSGGVGEGGSRTAFGGSGFAPAAGTVSTVDPLAHLYRGETGRGSSRDAGELRPSYESSVGFGRLSQGDRSFTMTVSNTTGAVRVVGGRTEEVLQWREDRRAAVAFVMASAESGFASSTQRDQGGWGASAPGDTRSASARLDASGAGRSANSPVDAVREAQHRDGYHRETEAPATRLRDESPFSRQQANAHQVAASASTTSSTSQEGFRSSRAHAETPRAALNSPSQRSVQREAGLLDRRSPGRQTANSASRGVGTRERTAAKVATPSTMRSGSSVGVAGSPSLLSRLAQRLFGRGDVQVTSSAAGHTVRGGRGFVVRGGLGSAEGGVLGVRGAFVRWREALLRGRAAGRGRGGGAAAERGRRGRRGGRTARAAKGARAKGARSSATSKAVQKISLRRLFLAVVRDAAIDIMTLRTVRKLLRGGVTRMADAVRSSAQRVPVVRRALRMVRTLRKRAIVRVARATRRVSAFSRAFGNRARALLGFGRRDGGRVAEEMQQKGQGRGREQRRARGDARPEGAERSRALKGGLRWMRTQKGTIALTLRSGRVQSRKGAEPNPRRRPTATQRQAAARAVARQADAAPGRIALFLTWLLSSMGVARARKRYQLHEGLKELRALLREDQGLLTENSGQGAARAVERDERDQQGDVRENGEQRDGVSSASGGPSESSTGSEATAEPVVLTQVEPTWNVKVFTARQAEGERSGTSAT